jgi:hypothetical protein
VTQLASLRCALATLRGCWEGYAASRLHRRESDRAMLYALAPVMVASFESQLVPGVLVVFGEVHGTAEVPAFVGQMLDQPHPVMLGIEWPPELQPAVDAFVAGQTDRAELVAALHDQWTEPDGRGSEAMVELVARAHALRAAGHDVRVTCFDRWPENVELRDESMAEELLAAVDLRAVNLALCGNLHARTSSPQFMGWHLRERHDALLALNLADTAGTAWCVLRDREPGIVEFPGDPRHETRASDSIGVTLFDQRDEDGYDGELFVGRITASPPER